MEREETRGEIKRGEERRAERWRVRLWSKGVYAASGAASEGAKAAPYGVRKGVPESRAGKQPREGIPIRCFDRMRSTPSPELPESPSSDSLAAACRAASRAAAIAALELLRRPAPHAAGWEGRRRWVSATGQGGKRNEATPQGTCGVIWGQAGQAASGRGGWTTVGGIEMRDARAQDVADALDCRLPLLLRHLRRRLRGQVRRTEGGQKGRRI